MIISVLTFLNVIFHLCNVEVDGTLFVHLFAASLLFALVICLSFNAIYFLNVDFSRARASTFRTESLYI